MGFAAVARVTDERWVACSVLDNILFGLKPGGELKLETTICHEIRQMRKAVVIDHVAEDEEFREHHTPRMYGFQSYISMPIILANGTFFGTLCAIDPKPHKVKTPEIVGMFKLFAELIAFHIDASEKLASSESRLLVERESSVLREQFIGVLGHDLRTPLGAISMGVSLLKDGALDEDQSMAVDMMERSVSHMSDLIADTLDFTRGRLGGGIELGSLSLAPLEPVLGQVISEMQSIWPARVIETHFDLAESVSYDRSRLAQLFTNLLSNAMAYGRADQAVVVRAVSADGTFSLSVSNGADPIPPEKLERLFEPFSRRGADKSEKGLGLGLYIASEIARSHGGKLSVKSTPEETCFTFTMPTARG
jgi:signal transduction histidine kinase